MPITVQNLSYYYDFKTKFQKTALENIDLTINDGDFAGIVGHTGSGKSTLVSHFNALIKVQSGAVFVDEQDLTKKIDYKLLRAKVGMVFQYPEYQLFDETVYKDIAYGPKNLKLPQEEIDARVRQAVAQVGLDFDEIAERSPFELSGGQMRRAALAGVLAMRPEILILDEPTAGLDPKGKREIMSLIRNLRGVTRSIIMISHNMDEVAENCSRIIVLSDGKLYGDYTPAQLFKNTALIKSLNMDTPSVVELTEALSARGMNIEVDTFDEDALADKIAAAKKGGGYA